jgi:hypothetical protein
MRAAIGPDEPEVRADDPMPKGYRFVPKGNVYITKNCRKKTHDADKTLYVVVDERDKPLGLRCPSHIYHAVMREHRATAEQRAAAVQKRDAAIEESFEETMVTLFPKIPKAEIPQILKHSLKKHSRRVGRTGTVALHDRVKLAVRAHIRHVHTDYDQLLKQGVDRVTAREKVWARLNEVARLWGGRPLKPAMAAPAKERLVKKTRAVSSLRRESGINGAVKKAEVQTARVVICRESSDTSGFLSVILRVAHQARPEYMRFGVQTRATTNRAVPSVDEDTMMAGIVDAEANGLVEDVDVQGDVFNKSEDTSDYDSDGKESCN